jgi:hypothetical protein
VRMRAVTLSQKSWDTGVKMPATFVTGIVLTLAIGLALGAAIAGLWFRSRPAPTPAPAVTAPENDPAQPVADALARIELQIREVESKRQHMLGGLEHHLTSLSRETVALSQALRAPNSRGR